MRVLPVFELSFVFDKRAVNKIALYGGEAGDNGEFMLNILENRVKITSLLREY